MGKVRVDMSQSFMQLPVVHQIVAAPTILKRATLYKCLMVKAEVVTEGNYQRFLVSWKIVRGRKRAANDNEKPKAEVKPIKKG